MEQAAETLASKLGTVLFGENLKEYTTLAVGGEARYLFVAQNIEDLIMAVTVAQENNINYRVIGGGSQLIFSDNEYDGLVIINKTQRIIEINENHQIMCDSGVKIDTLVSYAAERGLSGMEKFSGCAGTVGAAVYNNIRVGKKSINNLIRSVTLLSSSGKLSIKPAEWLDADGVNRLRVNQTKPWTVLVATFQFQPRRYNDINKDITKYRNNNKQSPNSINNIFESDDNDIDMYLKNSKVARMRVGDIEIPKHNINSLKNISNGSATDARRLCEKVIEKIKTEQDVEIYERIDYLGRWH